MIKLRHTRPFKGLKCDEVAFASDKMTGVIQLYHDGYCTIMFDNVRHKDTYLLFTLHLRLKTIDLALAYAEFAANNLPDDVEIEPFEYEEEITNIRMCYGELE